MTNSKMHDYSTSIMQAWKDALLQSLKASNVSINDSIHTSINAPISTEEKQQLNTLVNNLPIFAMIVVAKNHNNNSSDEFQPIINDWLTAQADTPAGWHAINVDDFDNFYNDNSDKSDNSDHNFINQTLANANINVAADRVSQVSVLRYVLHPSSKELLAGVNDEKCSAIAQVLDKQLTHHLETVLKLDGSDFDCHILPISHLLQVHKVACFDMDSTLIEQEVIVELAKATGIGRQVNEITESAMRGEIEFTESFAKRLRLLHGTHDYVLEDISDSLVLSAGAKTTLCILNALGYRTVLVSGGFTFFASMIADKLNIAEFHANELMVEDGKVIGEIVPPVVDGARKAELVKQIAKHQGVELSEVICIGDGANDLEMMAVANLGFAYRAKPIVQAKADLAINCTGLEGVLYGLGYGAIAVGD